MTVKDSNDIADARMQFKIHGMDCAEEVTALKRELGPFVGGEQNLRFDLVSGRLAIADATEVSQDKEALVIIQPDTVVGWHREGFRR